MGHLLKITDFYRELYPEIQKFQIVLYTNHGDIKHYFWVDVQDIYKPSWLEAEIDALIESRRGVYNLYPDDFHVGLSNCFEMTDGSKRFPPFIDLGIRSWRTSPDGMYDQDTLMVMQQQSLSRVKIVLELLQVGRGIIVDSGNDYHFFGLELWTKDQWELFVNNGTWSRSPLVLIKDKLPFSPAWDSYAASCVGELWGQLVKRQKYSYFLRVSDRVNSPEIVDVFDGEKLVLVYPPDDAACQIGLSVAKENYSENEKRAWEKAQQGDFSAFAELDKLELTHFCKIPCPYADTTWWCPSIQIRLGYMKPSGE